MHKPNNLRSQTGISFVTNTTVHYTSFLAAEKQVCILIQNKIMKIPSQRQDQPLKICRPWKLKIIQFSSAKNFPPYSCTYEIQKHKV